MRKCLSCHTENSADMHFCQHCGEQLQSMTVEPVEAAQESVTSETRTASKAPKEPREPMKAITKILLALITILILGVGVAHFIIQSQLAPLNQLTAANKAFVNENYEDFLAFFDFEEDAVVDAHAFYKYMATNNWIEDMSPQIEEGFKSLEGGSFAEPIVDLDGVKVATILDEKFLGVYKKYRVKLTPIEVTVSAPIEQAKLTYAKDQSVELTNEPTVLGMFLPGIYSFTLEVTDDFTTGDVTVGKSIVNSENDEQLLSFDLAEHTLSLSSDYADAIVFINDKSTEKTAAELELFTIPLDGSVTMYAEYGEGETKATSEKVEVTEQTVHLPFEEVQKELAVSGAKEALLTEYEASAKSFFMDFRESYENAVNYGDFSYVSNYFQEGTALKQEYNKFVSNHRTFDYYYEYDFLVNDVLGVEAIDENTIGLTSLEIFNFYASNDGDWKYEREKKYTIKVIDESLYITDIKDSKALKKTRLN